MENIKENNKLIAEFLGYPLDEKENLHWIDAGESYGYKTNDLKYHTDWNWLMEAVEKIEDIQDGEEGDSFRSHLYDITIRQHVVTVENTDIEVAEYGSKLLNTYYAVVEFIKFYNEEK